MMLKSCRRLVGGLAVGLCLLAAPTLIGTAQAQQQKPNILVIMGDDVGWFNIGAYHQGIMSGKTRRIQPISATPSNLTR